MMHNAMIFDTMIVRLSGAPVCRCAVCTERRAAQLTQALQNKFGSGPAARRIR
jgi:hypothetical protein